MHPDETLRCNACGQVVCLRKEGTLTDLPAVHCPYCGRPALTPAPRGASLDALAAPVFGTLPRPLVQLLYEQWGGTPALRAQFPAFIGYFYHVLAEATK